MCDRPGVMEETMNTEKEMEELLVLDELYWKQRARVDWLAEGDRNAKYFHARATARKKKNRILKLMDDNGSVVDSEHGIARLIKGFFLNLYQSSKPTSREIAAASDKMTKQIKEPIKEELAARFTKEEVRTALFELGPVKAPGPDGYHAIFFQKYWDIVGSNVSEVCLKILQGEESIRPFNSTDVVLLPKKKNPLFLKDFHPFSLSTVVYKVVAKVVANRMKGVLDSLISLN